MHIKIDSLKSNEVIRFLNDHLLEMQQHSPPESIHALDIKALRGDDVVFRSAWNDNKIIACAALKTLNTNHAELKSMRTSANERRQGIASTLLRFIINEAIKRGFNQVSLETGSMKAFEPARKLYTQFGFVYTQQFGNYELDKNSLFMTKFLNKKQFSSLT